MIRIAGALTNPFEPRSCRSVLVAEDSRPMGRRQECVDAMPIRVKPDRVRPALSRYGLEPRESTDVEYPDEPRIADRDIEAPQGPIEEDDVGRAGEWEIGHDLVGGRRQHE